MDREEVNSLEEVTLDNKNERTIHMFIELGMPRNIAKTIMYISEMNLDKKKRIKKNRMNMYYGEEDEDLKEGMEEQYDDYVNRPLTYPPDSDFPTVNDNHPLNAEFMVIDSTAW